jgi:two-component system, NtrC family, response regulator HydG
VDPSETPATDLGDDEAAIHPIGGIGDAATNDDLQENTRKGEFREDLFHRLNEFSIKAMPLRERKSDLPHFVNLFLNKSNITLERNVTGISEEVTQIFQEYHWPGNLRELKNIIRRAVLLTGEGEIKPEAIPSELSEPERTHVEVNSARDLKSSFEEQEKSLIIKTLEEVRHNKSKAAKILNMDRKTLYNKLEKYGLD